MRESGGEGVGNFRIAIDPKLRPNFDKLPLTVQKHIRARLERAAVDPSSSRAVLVEGQYMIDGTALDDGKLYWYSGVRFSYDPRNHVIVLTSVPSIREIPGQH